MARIKYMGVSHVHQLLEGDDFGGRLSKPLAKTVSFDKSNNWVVDSNDVGLNAEALEVLLLDPDFRDVSNDSPIPLNRAQRTWYGMKDTPAEVPSEEEQPEPDSEPTTGAPEGDANEGEQNPDHAKRAKIKP